MAGAHAGAGVAVEIFVKEDQVTPVGVSLELFEIPEYRSAAILILEENIGHAARQFSRDFPQVIKCPDPVGNSTLKSSPK